MSDLTYQRLTLLIAIASLLVGILSDLMYVFVDPRIDFEKRAG